MRTTPLYAMLLIVTSANAQEPFGNYRQALEYCAGLHMRNMDDGISSAATVARALLGVCRRQNQSLFDQTMAGKSRGYIEGYEKAAAEQFTNFVLMHRASKMR